MQDRPDLERRLESHAPASLLAIGRRAGELLAPFLNAHPDCRVEYLDRAGELDAQTLLEQLAKQPRFDFVVVRGVLERFDAQHGAHLLACLRDVHSSHFCVALEAADERQTWPPAELIAMGLSQWPGERAGDAELDIYGFELGSYKATPDWLNARHWAHPEHWGKFRW